MSDEEKHRVAWADRVGINKQWARDIEACSDAFGTDEYATAVRRWRINIPNIKKGPQLRDLIDKYEREVIEEWKDKQLRDWANDNPDQATNPAYIREKVNNIDEKSNELLYRYMFQLIQDEGFGFYESNIDEDTMQ